MSKSLEELLREHSLSSYREGLIEHIFIAEIIQAAWLKGKAIIVSKAEVDAWGYDIVLSSNGITRHIQLKSQTRNKSVTVNGKLAETPGACVIKAIPSISEDGQRIVLQYRLFQKGPNSRLDFSDLKNAKLTRYGKGSEGQAIRKTRPNHFKIPVSRFGPILNAEELVQKLFGS